MNRLDRKSLDAELWVRAGVLLKANRRMYGWRKLLALEEGVQAIYDGLLGAIDNRSTWVVRNAEIEGNRTVRRLPRQQLEGELRACLGPILTSDGGGRLSSRTADTSGLQQAIVTALLDLLDNDDTWVMRGDGTTPYMAGRTFHDQAGADAIVMVPRMHLGREEPPK